MLQKLTPITDTYTQLYTYSLYWKIDIHINSVKILNILIIVEKGDNIFVSKFSILLKQ